MYDSQPDVAADDATRAFVEHRELLFSIVYNMLGSVADTDDALQETWLAWAARTRDTEAEPIDNPRGYLVRIAVNMAVAHQATVRRSRESYVGPWLPEPLVTSEERGDAADASAPVVAAESVSMALLVVLESLSPLERAVFVLREVFGYGYAEIAGILGRRTAAVRQLGHRARNHVQARRPRFRTDARIQRQVTERFIAAAVGGDLVSLLELLAPDVTVWTDGGGKVPKAGPRPVQGREKVARLITGFTRGADEFDIRYRHVNHDPSAVLFDRGTPIAVMVLDLTDDGDQIRGIYTVANPDKLSHTR